jgi:hypothetical protein
MQTVTGRGDVSDCVHCMGLDLLLLLLLLLRWEPAHWANHCTESPLTGLFTLRTGSR